MDIAKQDEVAALSLHDPLRESLSCGHCRYHEEWQSAGPYSDMCNCPDIVSMLDSTNTVVRCNEAREFKFACGAKARYFKIKAV